MTDQIPAPTPTLTVPDAGWYPDRGEPGVMRWWDGGQWTDHTHRTAQTVATEQPVSAAAFGFAPVESAPMNSVSGAAALSTAQPVRPVALIAPGWYQDPLDPNGRRWWDGGQWSAHSAPPVALGVNSMATRGMIYSLIALVLNPLGILGIGGFVLGIRGLRRTAQFAPENARRGHAIAAIIVGAAATVIVGLLVAAAVAIPIARAQQPHVFDRVGAQRDLLAQLTSSSPGESAVSVSCPPDNAMKVGDAFDCTALLENGQALPIHITIGSHNGVFTYSWTANRSESTPLDDSSDSVSS